MFIPRLYYQQPLRENRQIILQGDLHQRLTKVLRLRVGETLHLFNETAGEFKTTILKINRKETLVALKKQIKKPIPPPLKLHLGQGLSRQDRIEWVIQKATELGVTCITPLLTQHAQPIPPAATLAHRLKRWQNIAISAAEQCGRLDIPTIESLITLDQWLTKNAFKQGFLCDKKVPLATLPDTLLNNQPTGLLIGPESGFKAIEIDLINGYAFHGLNLGPRTLRTETAAITAITLLQYQYGDIGPSI